MPYIGLSYFLIFILYTQTHYLSGIICPTYRTLAPEKQLLWHTYVYSFVHAIVMSLFSVYAISDRQMWADPVWQDSPISRIACAICIGYMFFDTTVVLYHHKVLWDWYYLFHHFATVYAYYQVVGYGALNFFAIYRLLAEISTPFVDLRWFIDTVGYPKTSKQNIVNGVLMTLAFFFVRILAMPHYWYIVYTVYGTDSFNNTGYMRWVLFLSCVILDSINVFWFYKMCRGVTKVICLKFDANRNEIQAKQD